MRFAILDKKPHYKKHKKHLWSCVNCNFLCCCLTSFFSQGERTYRLPPSSVPCMVKTLDLYGLILMYWTMALYGLIFTWTLQHKTLLKNQPRH